MIIEPGSPQYINGSPEYNALLYGKTNLNGYFFDAFLRVDYSRELAITEHPVETGASLADHAYLEPLKLTFEVGMSDVHTSIVAGQFEDRWSRSASAWDVLEQMQRDRIPLTALTRLGRYDNLLIKSLAQSDDYRSLNGLRATVTCQQVFVAQVRTVTVSGLPQVTDSTQRGTLQATPVVDVSILYQIYDALRGGG